MYWIPLLSIKSLALNIYNWAYGTTTFRDEPIKKSALIIKDTSIVGYAGLILLRPDLALVIHAMVISYGLTMLKIIGAALVL